MKSTWGLRPILVLPLSALLLILATGYWYWQSFVQPPQLTRLYEKELAKVISGFEATELSLEVQLHPDKILAIATREYFENFKTIFTPINCPHCDRFWVTISAEALDLCVREYSSTQSVVRATIKRTGYLVDAVTHEPLQSEKSWQDRSTYHLVMEDKFWKVSKITGYTPAAKGEADLLEVLNENWVELGCH